MNFQRERIAKELHRPAIRKFQRRQVIIKGYNDLWQADLVEMIPYARINKGFKFILMVIDTFSKFLWAAPIKNKTGEEVTKAMKSILTYRRRPLNLQTDDGKEFFNKHFAALMTENKINHYSTYSNLKASIVERVNRTIKSRMWQQFSLQGDHKWFDILPKIVQKYNETVHRTTKMRPIDVTVRDKRQLLQTAYRVNKRKAPVHFKVGDHVRISKYKHVFKKGYLPNWTTETFIVDKVQRTNPTTYLLHDMENEPILGAFYRQELQKTKYPGVYLKKQ